MTETLNIVRSYELFKPEDSLGATIIGAGATGSRVFEQLISLGVEDINVFDFDTVESHNIGNQVYDTSDIGNHKVHALRSYCERKLGYVPNNTHFRKSRFMASSNRRLWQNSALPEKLSRTLLPHVVFLLVDSMDQRRKIGEYLKTRETCAYIIETRMGSTYGYSYCFNPHIDEEYDRWAATLFEDEEVETPGVCRTQITVGSTAQLIASLAVSSYINLHGPSPIPFKQGIYTQPYYYEQEM